MSNPVRFVQISDTHLYGDVTHSLLGVNTEQSFQATVDLIKQEAGQLDFIIHSGDLSQDGSKESYVRLADTFKPFNIPIYFVPGNHDDPDTLKAVYPRALVDMNKHIVLKHWQIILLDSQVPGKVEGKLAQSQLAFMQQCLEKHPHLKAIIIFHHQPVPVGARWLDNLGVHNADEFWQALAPFQSVEAVLFSHVHQVYQSNKNNIQLLSTPSTCFQFMHDQDEFGLENLPPGFRVVELYDDGRMLTEVKRVAKYIGTFDKTAKGY